MTGDSGANASDRPSDGRTVSRRRLLAAAAGAGVASLPGRTRAQGQARTADRTATLRVRVYPGPKPFYAWLRSGGYGIGTGWSRVHRDAARAVRETMESLAAYVRRNSGLDEVNARVEPRRPVSLSVLSGAPSVVTVPMLSRESIFQSFHDLLASRGDLDEACCHLLLWWDPLNYGLGYGGTWKADAHVGNGTESSLAAANVGASQYWDSRAVTRNLAIHETLHTFLAPDIVEDVTGSPCDHNLGQAVRTDRNTMRVSPMATAYAGDERAGVGTRWHGTGCYDHDEFSRHDGTDDVDGWEYTTELSAATREAVGLYVERYLAGPDRG